MLALKEKMQVIKTRKALKSTLSSLKQGISLGLVPTMGALHKGHLALVERALHQNDTAVLTIFVNPTQFNNQEDLDKYPKNLKSDVDLLHSISEDIIIFAPSIKEIYNNDVSSKIYGFNGLEKVMEGAFREGHFNGVATVVENLLRIVNPNRAYFGEKDFQQLQIIRKMVEIQNLPVKIVSCPIVREPNGLAMSSRNERLSTTTRKEAAFIYQTLQAAKKQFGTKSAQKVIESVKRQFEKQKNLRLEYIEITDAETLSPIKRKIKNIKYRAFVAVYADDVRLIDNIALN